VNFGPAPTSPQPLGFISTFSTGRILSSATAASGTTYERASQYDKKNVAAVLYQQLAEWKGVRHRYGGLDKSGVDCSGFVYLTLWRHFGLEVPRNTKELSRYGVAVSRSRLAPGDLVFFKTGLFKRHVGIYIEDGKLLHASTSRGVMLSDMEDGYWTRRYWKARRVLKMEA
jgi:cell wall-associated NlpC family hydrolase